MKVLELKEQLEQGKKLEDLIQVKPYLSFIEKKIFCEKVVEDCFSVDENGLVICDYFNRKIGVDIGLMMNYASLEFGEHYVLEYDYLVEKGVLDYILTKIPSEEKGFLYEAIYEVTEQKLRMDNSIEALLAKGLNAIVQKLPTAKELEKLIKVAGKQFKDFDPEKLQILGNALQLKN